MSLSSVRVIVCGTHSYDWYTAMGPDAPVWRGLPDVAEVLMFRAEESSVLDAGAYQDMATVIVPLLEPHILNRPAGFHELSPSRRAVEILGNKRRFAAYVKNRALAAFAPKTFGETDALSYPCVIKRADQSGGAGIAVLSCPDDYTRAMTDERWAGCDYLIQDFIAQPRDYVTYCVCRNGRIIWDWSFECELNPQAPIRSSQNGAAGPSLGFKASRRILDQIEAFLGPLNYDGPCNIDYKLNDDGSLCVIEINPRLGGSLMRPENVDILQDMLHCLIDSALNRGTAHRFARAA